MWEIFCGISPVPQNIIMDLNNAMTTLLIPIHVCYYSKLRHAKTISRKCINLQSKVCFCSVMFVKPIELSLVKK
jgi:hypothetical protein